MSEAIRLEGTVKVIFDEQTFASGFNKLDPINPVAPVTRILDIKY